MDMSSHGSKRGSQKSFKVHLRHEQTQGYFKVTVDPAKNDATAEKWIVAAFKEDNSKEKTDVFKTLKK
jgi:hypothetical protein